MVNFDQLTNSFFDQLVNSRNKMGGGDNPPSETIPADHVQQVSQLSSGLASLKSHKNRANIPLISWLTHWNVSIIKE